MGYKRRHNFLPGEIRILVAQVGANYDALYGRQAERIGVSGQLNIWRRICNDINAIHHQHREVEALKKRWRLMRRQVRKKAEQVAIQGPDGELSLTALERKILDTVGPGTSADVGVFDTSRRRAVKLGTPIPPAAAREAEEEEEEVAGKMQGPYWPVPPPPRTSAAAAAAAAVPTPPSPPEHEDIRVAVKEEVAEEEDEQGGYESGYLKEEEEVEVEGDELEEHQTSPQNLGPPEQEIQRLMDVGNTIHQEHAQLRAEVAGLREEVRSISTALDVLARKSDAINEHLAALVVEQAATRRSHENMQAVLANLLGQLIAQGHPRGNSIAQPTPQVSSSQGSSPGTSSWVKGKGPH
uniref:Myb-related transcription factor, partner of profilin-like n=1 Tax=Geotrypetes seraphini TaxID=260995 RepID=A0A6P8P189_GEOSA|nr:myb-related transcription factor, partner of profilin-like [Geotrypetes seraphini]